MVGGISYSIFHALRCNYCDCIKCITPKSSSFNYWEKVRVNWTERDTVAFELQEGDILSIRGSGRVKIIMTEGRTKR